MHAVIAHFRDEWTFRTRDKALDGRPGSKEKCRGVVRSDYAHQYEQPCAAAHQCGCRQRRIANTPVASQSDPAALRNCPYPFLVERVRRKVLVMALDVSTRTLNYSGRALSRISVREIDEVMPPVHTRARP